MPAQPSMSAFRTEREAKKYLVAQIVAEAKREDVPLADLERKMLYFSETGWTLPNMLEVNAEFERNYNNDEYEEKIAALVRTIEKQNEIAGNDQQARWDDAILKLSEGDHYLLVLIDQGHSPDPRPYSKWLPAFNLYGTGRRRPPGDFIRLILVAFVAILIIVPLVFLSAWIKDRLGN
jgi:hypothetical protein